MDAQLKSLVDLLEEEHHLSSEEFIALISNHTDTALHDYVTSRAEFVRQQNYQQDVYIRGLIEFTNYCKNNCFYCGIRKGNQHAERYRLTQEQILGCCEQGYGLGFRTFVLQGGEDEYYTTERITSIVKAIKQTYPDCAITLSIGEQTHETYKAWKEAGADRYLLRHETANSTHYQKLHPKTMSLQNRMDCLFDLKSLGYQVGTGFMVGSPGQTVDCLAEDLAFIEKLQPSMVGIGPFIPHKDTIFANETAGTLELTLFLVGLLRLMLPYALLPSTTALGTIDPRGREKGIQAGANVVMPILSPMDVRGKYLLYDGKICTGDEAAECRYCMELRMKGIGYDVVVNRGDVKESIKNL